MSDADSGRVAFIGTLDLFDVPYGSEDGAVQQAKGLCLWYEVNDTFFEMGAAQLLKENPEFTPEDAGHFAGAATAIYCPEHGPKGGG
ncbi:DUF732 domain-containing protein [Mycolicibacterium pyrenivorans]|uniref:DUF732 domain-containing protein n=1 Tax=Mycolicibacterium pyrenivorans TaxID=187102 RepID=UPI0021F3C6C2|nr:DUF732 domain-containing protein [Mycolicibacterium pyrenivorans]MCV7154343.1 DUF732 domain-containing protein [Mycolicibacterium pyrenivorans]